MTDALFIFIGIAAIIGPIVVLILRNRPRPTTYAMPNGKQRRFIRKEAQL